jgi:hypothetical protein
MIQLRPYDDLSAMVVIERLDAHDRLEAEIVRGAATTYLRLFADWQAQEAVRITSLMAFTPAAKPFAIFALSNTGQAGVAEAALLARDHRQFRRPLAELGLMLRAGIPDFARRMGIHRIEARAWSKHPTAGRLLESLGFRAEADMPGFGATGAEVYRQYAWLSPACFPFTSIRS